MKGIGTAMHPDLRRRSGPGREHMERGPDLNRDIKTILDVDATGPQQGIDGEAQRWTTDVQHLT